MPSRLGLLTDLGIGHSLPGLAEAIRIGANTSREGHMAETAGVEITGPINERFDAVLTPDAIEFLGGLHREFDSRRRDLLEARATRYAQLAHGGTLDFLAETRAVRDDDSWKVAEPRLLA